MHGWSGGPDQAEEIERSSKPPLDDGLMIGSMDLTTFLRDELAAEAEVGFPRLRRVPQTKILQFLDYFAASSPGDRSALLDALAIRAAIRFQPGMASGFPPAPAWDRYWNTINSPGPFSGGFRYSDVKFLAMVPRIKEFGGYEGWIEKTQRA
jgi:hypothetical protein